MRTIQEAVTPSRPASVGRSISPSANTFYQDRPCSIIRRMLASGSAVALRPSPSMRRIARPVRVSRTASLRWIGCSGVFASPSGPVSVAPSSSIAGMRIPPVSLDWTEGRSAPASIIAAKFKPSEPSEVEMQRPLCPYPEKVRYVGAGSTNAPANFECR